MSYFKNIKWGIKSVPFIQVGKLNGIPISQLFRISFNSTKIDPKGLDDSRTYSNIEYNNKLIN